MVSIFSSINLLFLCIFIFLYFCLVGADCLIECVFVQLSKSFNYIKDFGIIILHNSIKEHYKNYFQIKGKIGLNRKFVPTLIVYSINKNLDILYKTYLKYEIKNIIY